MDVQYKVCRWMRVRIRIRVRGVFKGGMIERYREGTLVIASHKTAVQKLGEEMGGEL